ARLTRKPALTLTPTINIRPSQVCGACKGESPRATLTTKTLCSESINPARQIAHVTPPANRASTRETTRDFQVKAFNFGDIRAGRYVPWVRTTGRNYTLRKLLLDQIKAGILRKRFEGGFNFLFLGGRDGPQVDDHLIVDDSDNDRQLAGS